MSYRILFTLNALVAAMLGGFFLILPESALTVFGTEVYVAMLLAGRFIGGGFLMTGVLIWFLKDVSMESMQRNLAIALLGGSVGGFVLTLLGMTSSGVIRTNGWIPLVICVVFALGYAFLAFLQPQQQAMPGGYRKQV